MTEAPNILDETETRASTRHAELVSASTVPSQGLHQDHKWTLKQVQGDENGGIV